VFFLQSPIPAAAIRDTISRIVLERGYRRSVTSTLLSRGWEWITRTLGDLFRQAAGSRGTFLITLTLLVVLIVALVARAAIVAHARRQASFRREAGISADEQLAQARGLAAQGAHVQAAHLLYAAVVSRLVEHQRVRRHPSKTVGDYWRELRTRGDGLALSYQSFARMYENVVYGDGLCDTTRYARLEQLAAPVLQLGARVISVRAA